MPNPVARNLSRKMQAYEEDEVEFSLLDQRSIRTRLISLYSSDLNQVFRSVWQSNGVDSMDEDVEDFHLDEVKRYAVLAFLPAAVVSGAKVLGMVTDEILVDMIELLIGANRDCNNVTKRSEAKSSQSSVSIWLQLLSYPKTGSAVDFWTTLVMLVSVCDFARVGMKYSVRSSNEIYSCHSSLFAEWRLASGER